MRLSLLPPSLSPSLTYSFTHFPFPSRLTHDPPLPNERTNALAGRCSFEAGHRHVDVSQVVWLGTSNVGHDLVFEHHAARAAPDAPMTRAEYVALTALLRPRVSERLGVRRLSVPLDVARTDQCMIVVADTRYSR